MQVTDNRPFRHHNIYGTTTDRIHHQELKFACARRDESLAICDLPIATRRVLSFNCASRFAMFLHNDTDSVERDTESKS